MQAEDIFNHYFFTKTEIITLMAVVYVVERNTLFEKVLMKLKLFQSELYLGEMFTSRIHGFKFSSSRMSNPKSSWQQYLLLAFDLVMLFIGQSPLKENNMCYVKQKIRAFYLIAGFDRKRFSNKM